MSNRRQRYGILPGAFNPVTKAHLAMAAAALSLVDQVLFVLPRELPHKQYSGVTFLSRLDLLRQATAKEPRYLVVESNGGLFIEIAQELRALLPSSPDLFFLCGRDAAERIVGWDYGSGSSISQILDEFGLLVAPRDGDYQIPPSFQHRISRLPLEPVYQAISATDVRQRILDGNPWHHLVPAEIHGSVTDLYCPGTAPSTD